MRTTLIILASVALTGGKSRERDRTPTVIAFGGAAFTFPSEAEADPRIKPVQYGPSEDQVITVQSQRLRHKEVLYTLTVTELPDRGRRAKPEAILAGAKRGLLGPPGTGGTLESSEDRAIDGHPGLALIMRAGKLRVRARLAVADGRLVQLTAVGVAGAIKSPEVDAALDSLAVGESNP